MMTYASAVACLFLTLYLRISEAAPFNEPSEIAPYTVLKKTPNYEIRSYGAANWVCRNHEGTSFKNRDQAMVFFDLFDYISGQNSKAAKIDMTAPVTVYTRPSDDGVNTVYQMCFYVPAIHQRDTPMPVDPLVYLEGRPTMTVAARRFGGYVKNQGDWTAQTNALKSALVQDNEHSFMLDSFYGATYNAPYKFVDRRNEVWLVKIE